MVLGVLLLAGLATTWSYVRARTGERQVGLFTTLPILWDEAADVGEMLRQPAPPHWARAKLAGAGKVVPLDTLAGPAGHSPLARLDIAVLAQPRPLSPDENVALDQWVRGGGKVLLFADPALTEDSAFAIGDPRRPQAVVLLSPILRRWGLELEFDDAQPFGERTVDVMGAAVPVNLPGRFRIADNHCRLWGDSVAVTCAVGKGRVVALADAAVLERDDPDGARAKAFALLLQAASAGR